MQSVLTASMRLWLAWQQYRFGHCEGIGVKMILNEKGLGAFVAAAAGGCRQSGAGPRHAPEAGRPAGRLALAGVTPRVTTASGHMSVASGAGCSSLEQITKLALQPSGLLGKMDCTGSLAHRVDA